MKSLKNPPKLSLHARIDELVAAGELLPGTSVVLESIESSVLDGKEVVHIEFLVPQEISESVDARTGAFRAGSDGVRYQYTFSGATPLRQTLVRFREFYAKRSEAVRNLPDVERTVPRPSGSTGLTARN